MVLEMRGAQARMRREREMIWWGAMLPYLKKPFPLAQFVGKEVSPVERVRSFHSTWDKVDRALARGR